MTTGALVQVSYPVCPVRWAFAQAPVRREGMRKCDLPFPHFKDTDFHIPPFSHSHISTFSHSLPVLRLARALLLIFAFDPFLELFFFLLQHLQFLLGFLLTHAGILFLFLLLLVLLLFL